MSGKRENQREGTKTWKVKQKMCMLCQKEWEIFPEVKDSCLNVMPCYGASDKRKIASLAASQLVKSKFLILLRADKLYLGNSSTTQYIKLQKLIPFWFILLSHEIRTWKSTEKKAQLLRGLISCLHLSNAESANELWVSLLRHSCFVTIMTYLSSPCSSSPSVL